MRLSTLALVLAAPLMAAPLLALSSAHATVVRALSLEEKTQVAPLVIHASVERVESAWDLPGESINTLISLRVIESVRGGADKGAHIVVRQGGGKIGDFSQVAAGQSRYEPGEEVVVFLEPVGSEYVEIGIGISKYSIEWNGHEKMVSPPPRGRRSAHREERPSPLGRAAQPMKPETLSKFLDRLRGYVASASAQKNAGMKQ